MQKLQDVPGFPLSTEQCRLLLALEHFGSAREAADALGRDLSVISRQIVEISLIAPVVEKTDGRWRISELGRNLNSCSRDSLLAQRRVLNRKSSLRIATTPEFSARILAPGLRWFLDAHPRTQISIQVSDTGVESLLIRGDADIGLDCGRPESPAIRFRRVTDEKMALVASPRLVKGLSLRALEGLLKLPHIHFDRIPSLRALRLASSALTTAAVFSDIGGARSACIAGLGWAILPRYAVRKELEARELVELPLARLESERFGVWWLRDRSTVEPFVASATKWLKEQRL